MTMNMNNTATITWIKYNNFGTLLQAYALQQFILSLGYDNHILDDRSVRVYQPPIPLEKRIANCIKSALKMFIPKFRHFKEDNNKTSQLYDAFIETFLKVDSDTLNHELINERYGQFICGSDQIWNPGPKEIVSLNNKFYFADFTQNKRIAYGPSLGVTIYPPKKMEELGMLTKDFAYLSAREKTGCRIIEEATGHKCTHVVDPTLLLSESKWRKLVGKKVTEPYILAYFLTPNRWYTDYVRRYARRNGMRLLIFHNLPFSKSEADEFLAAGPLEFMSAIDKASMVFTDSFHGSIFSMILRTPFITFKRFAERTDYSGQNNRITTLFSLLGIPERFIDEDNLQSIGLLAQLDFDAMKERIRPTIDWSRQYLTNALKN